MATSSLRLQDVRGKTLREFVEAGLVELFLKPTMADDRTRRRCGATPQVSVCVCVCACVCVYVCVCVSYTLKHTTLHSSSAA